MDDMILLLANRVLRQIELGAEPDKELVRHLCEQVIEAHTEAD
jgi:hypothetical protein